MLMFRASQQAAGCRVASRRPRLTDHLVRTWLREWADSLSNGDSTDEAILLGAKLETILAAATDNVTHLTSLRVSWRELIILAPDAFNMSLWTSRKDRLLMIGSIDPAQEGFREPPTHLRHLSCLRNLFKEGGPMFVQWNGRFHCDAVLPRRADADNVVLRLVDHLVDESRKDRQNDSQPPTGLPGRSTASLEPAQERKRRVVRKRAPKKSAQRPVLSPDPVGVPAFPLASTPTQSPMPEGLVHPQVGPSEHTLDQVMPDSRPLSPPDVSMSSSGSGQGQHLPPHPDSSPPSSTSQHSQEQEDSRSLAQRGCLSGHSSLGDPSQQKRTL